MVNLNLGENYNFCNLYEIKGILVISLSLEFCKDL